MRSKFDVMPADGAFTRKLNTCHLRNSPVEVHVSECVTCDQHRYFRANSLKITSGWVPSRLGNARWVSKFDVLLAGGTFTRILNTWHYLRNSHAPVEVHVSECVTCEQHRYFQSNSSKNTSERVPSRLRNARIVSKFHVLLADGHLHGF